MMCIGAWQCIIPGRARGIRGAGFLWFWRGIVSGGGREHEARSMEYRLKRMKKEEKEAMAASFGEEKT